VAIDSAPVKADPDPSGEALAPGLYVVATPIGNRADITQRALEVLGKATVVACEDTRHTGTLLQHLGLKRPLLSCHDRNESTRAVELADRVAAGEAVALVADAGTPLVSDPGFRVVRECRRRSLPVFAVPGPCALAAALSVAGLPAHPVLFMGFLPAKSAARRRFLTEHQHAPYTLALYESCHRVAALAAEAQEILGDQRVACFARELTKRFETVLTGPLADTVPALTGRNLKGEFVVLIAPATFSL